MNEPWGISGPVFAWLYGLCAVLPVALAAANEWWLRRDTGARTVPGLYHLAALPDGVERVTDTAVAGLIARHSLRPDGRGVLHPIEPAPTDPVEHAVVSLVPGNGIGLRELRSKMARHEVVRALRADLEQRGLLVAEKHRRMGWQYAIGLSVAVLALGIVRLANAVPLNRPAGALVVLILGVAGLIGLAAWRQWPDKSGRATAAGTLALRYGDWDRGLGRTTAGRVALHGLQAFPDRVVAVALIRTGGTKARLFAGTASTCGGGGVYIAGSSCGGGGSTCGGGGSSCGGGGGGGGCGG
ncbi:TIGR04222 domain-containing membrane protein [Amycolatopsis sp. WAC 04169]|uniref:TIGR04222 domain-containing membrane protein n=1 Tax=Amycolatopsis sp. WAC 04169 TaxID=2203197 RepID=UPI000F79D63E|nr:TIGR04222 domain-containing membrane protein [Amycolatopsis sp. WAC 04169]RSN35194.1 TIGR04222 domain-containing membrane protein [Amycolatopsis sp. WAC 04169]